MRRIFLFVVLLISLCASAQQAVTSAGGSIKSAKTEVNWTVGETVTDSYVGSKASVTSGVNQPLLIVTTMVASSVNKVEITVYPNPTSSIVTIDVKGCEVIKLQIHSLSGQLIMSEEKYKTGSKINFGNYSNGVYILDITDNTGNINKYKIVKQ